MLLEKFGQKLLTSVSKFDLLVACESGSSNLLFSYFSTLESPKRVWAEGVAIEIAQRFKLDLIDRADLRMQYSRVNDIFVAGSVGDTFHQIQLINEICVDQSNRKFYVFDNWVNYAERFQNSVVKNVIVFDELAKDFAIKTFGSGINIEVKPNLYIQNMKIEVDSYQGVAKDSILIVGTRLNEFTKYTPGVHGLECFCKVVEAITARFKNLEIVFRPHPGVLENPCAEKLSSQRADFRYSTDVFSSDLSRAFLVLGNPTYALYVADQLGIQVGFLNPGNSKWHGPKYPSYQECLY